MRPVRAARVAELDRVGEEMVFSRYVELGTVRAVVEDLLEPTAPGLKDWGGGTSTSG